MDQFSFTDQPDKAGLGDLLRQLKDDSGFSLGDLTVLSPSNDPFRLDTPTGHLNGEWLRDAMRTCGLLARTNPIHNRGIHYALMSQGSIVKPDGKPYTNTLECWAFLEEKASKAARWLGHVPFEAVSDARNAEPIVRIADLLTPYSDINAPRSYDLPDDDDLRPSVVLENFDARQHYRIAIFGEKTSLQDVLRPISEDYGTDLYLPSGEISDTLVHTMAKVGDRDGRELIVLILADCDPAGYQMAVSIGHKLRALRELKFPRLNFSLIAPALTVEQVKDLGLPSTPLKETEKRAAGWRNRYGVEQTEIDALATLRPNVLSQIVRDAIEPYYDTTLRRRVSDARQDWLDEANGILAEALSTGEVGAIYAAAEANLTDLREHAEKLRAIVERLDISLPGIELPRANVSRPPAPLVSSNMELIDAIHVLRSRKDYGGGA